MAPAGFERKYTGTRALEGRVACKLDTSNYGREEWWLLLDAPLSLCELDWERSGEKI